MGKIINRIPGLRLLISSLLYSALGMLNRSTSPAISTSVLKSLPGKIDIKRPRLIKTIGCETDVIEMSC